MGEPKADDASFLYLIFTVQVLILFFGGISFLKSVIVKSRREKKTYFRFMMQLTFYFFLGLWMFNVF